MEQNQYKQWKVGIFVFIGLVVFVVSTLMFGGDSMFFSPKQAYRVQLPQAQGLNPGSIVTLSGVKIGNVNRLELAEDSTDVVVWLDIYSEFASRLTNGSLASLRTQGALGDKFIFIEPGPSDSTPISEEGFIALDKRKDLIDVLTSKGDSATEMNQILMEVRVLLESLNREGRAASIVENLNAGSGELTDFLKTGRILLDEFAGISEHKAEFKELLKHLLSILKKVDKGQGTLGAIVNDQTLHNQLVRILGDAPRNQFLKPLIRDAIKENENSDSSR